MGFLEDMAKLAGAGVRTSNVRKQRENMSPELKQKINKVASLAKSGNVEAMYALASWYCNGKEIKYPDYAKSAYWWKMAADKGHVDSQYNLGMLYLGVYAIEFTDNKAAAYWLSRAADRGDKAAKEALNKYFRKSLITGELKRKWDD